MVPELSHPAWRELIQGDSYVPSSHFGFNLLLTNNRIYYRKEPSEEHLVVLAEQIYEYLAKYEGLLPGGAEGNLRRRLLGHVQLRIGSPRLPWSAGRRSTQRCLPICRAGE